MERSGVVVCDETSNLVFQRILPLTYYPYVATVHHNYRDIPYATCLR